MASSTKLMNPSFLLVFFMFMVTSNLGFSIAFPETSPLCGPRYPPWGVPVVHPVDVDLLQFALNPEHLEADYFLYGAYGYGLDKFAPELVMGGPPPIGAMKANLDKLTQHIIEEFGLQEVGHLRYT